MFKTIQKYFKIVQETQKKVFTWVFLNFIYILGIGITAVVGKVFGQHFIGKPKLASNWQTHSGRIDLETMF